MDNCGSRMEWLVGECTCVLGGAPTLVTAHTFGVGNSLLLGVCGPAVSAGGQSLLPDCTVVNARKHARSPLFLQAPPGAIFRSPRYSHYRTHLFCPNDPIGVGSPIPRNVHVPRPTSIRIITRHIKWNEVDADRNRNGSRIVLLGLAKDSCSLHTSIPCGAVCS